MSFVPFTGDGTLTDGDFRALGQGVSGSVSSYIKTFANSPKPVRDSMINRGPNQLLLDVGVNPASLQMLKNKNELVTQIGLNAAANIFDNVVNGTLNADNADLFGNYDTNVSLTNIDPLAMNGTPNDILNLTNLSAFSFIFDKTFLSTSPFFDIFSGYKSGAQEMVDLGFIPKNEYTYVLTVQFDPKYAAISGLTELARSFIFLTKNFPRPSVRVENKKVNMYNYRTFVPVQTTFEPVQVTFVDDNRNASMRTFMTILKAISPIFNVANPHATIPQMENAGMDFWSRGQYRGVDVNTYSGSIGPLQTIDQWTNYNDIPAQTVIQYFRLYHLFDYGRSVNVYQYFRPRVTMVNMSALSMHQDQDEGAEIEMQFEYEAAYIEEGKAAASSSFPNRDPIKGIIEKSFKGDGAGAHMETRRGSGLVGGTNSNFDTPLGRIISPTNVQGVTDTFLQNPVLPDIPEVDVNEVIESQLEQHGLTSPDVLDQANADDVAERLQGTFEPNFPDL